MCFGCEALGGTDWGEVNIAEIEQAIEVALDLGVNFFDTASVYGLTLSEKRLAKILGPRKHEVYIATKGGLSWTTSSNGRAKVTKDSSPRSISAGVFGILKRMGLDRIPIYYIHWPDPKIPLEATFAVLQELKDEGLIGEIGCSNFDVKQIDIAMKYAEIKYVQSPLNIFADTRNEALTSFCTDHNLYFVAYNVLGSGMLTGKFDHNSTFAANDRRSRLAEFAGKKYVARLQEIRQYEEQASLLNLTLLEYALKWAFGQPSVASVITGIKSSDQLIMNWNALMRELPIHMSKN